MAWAQHKLFESILPEMVIDIPTGQLVHEPMTGANNARIVSNAGEGFEGRTSLVFPFVYGGRGAR